MLRAVVLYLFLTIFHCQLATAGSGFSFGGADQNTAPSEAWFYNPSTPVEVCIATTEHFGQPPSKVLNLFNEALEIWNSYYSEKRLEETDIEIEKRINLNYRATLACEGDEQLLIQSSLKKPPRLIGLYDDPISVAFKEKGVPGTIWLKEDPRFQSETYLLAILVHEVGHTLGLKHNAQTIMDAGIAEFDPSQAVRIDYERELSICAFCRIEISQELDDFSRDLLMKRFHEQGIELPAEVYQARLEIFGKGKSASSQPLYRLTLDGRDDSVTYDIRIGRVNFQFAQVVFESPHKAQAHYNFSSVDYGYMTSGEREISLNIEYNSLLNPSLYKLNFSSSRGELVSFLEFE